MEQSHLGDSGSQPDEQEDLEQGAPERGVQEQGVQKRAAPARALEQAARERAGSTRRIERILVRRALPFMLQHPVRAILDEVRKLLWYIVSLFAITIAISLLLSLSNILSLNKILENAQFHYVSRWQFIFFNLIAGFVLAVIGMFLIAMRHAFISSLRLWSRVGPTFALMLSVVALIFLLSDTWRILGGMAWWRMVVFFLIGAAVTLTLLGRNSSHAITGMDEKRRSNPIKFAKDVDHWLVRYTVKAGPSPSSVRFTRTAFLNLGLVLTLLFAFRILISGFIVFLALLATGAIMIDRQTTLSLLNVNSLANSGWSSGIDVFGHQFFISEALLKVALWLASLAAVYFVVVTMTTDQDQAYSADETTFLKEALALWSCYIAASIPSRFTIYDPAFGADELREAVRYAPDDVRLIYELFRNAQVYVLATCGPEEFSVAPHKDKLVYEPKHRNGPVLSVSTRRNKLKDEARRRKDALKVDVQVVAVWGSWLLAILENDVTIKIDEWRLRLTDAELKISSWRASR